MAATTVAADDDDTHAPTWIQLTDPKHLSRLLYTNPVCFLSTVTANKKDRRNVMTLSWLTATSNSGGLVCSLKKSRHTARTILHHDRKSGHHAKFVLSVPVQGMEDLVRDVGRISGRWGSKFRDDHTDEEVQENDERYRAVAERHETLSKRKRVKLEHERLSCGVPRLQAVKLGTTAPTSGKETELFAIRGTVAHLECRIAGIVQDGALVDKDHLLIAAQVSKAFVQDNYWDSTKNLFRPSDGIPPYLTFFGSQTFGYVTMK